MTIRTIESMQTPQVLPPPPPPPPVLGAPYAPVGQQVDETPASSKAIGPTPYLDTLNEQQRQFVWEMLVDQNATQAAVRAGYSRRSAGSQAHAMMKRPAIKAALTEARAILGKRAEITAEQVVKEFGHLAFADSTAVMEGSAKDGTLKVRELGDLTPAQRASISEITVSTTDLGEGVTVQTVRVKFHPKLPALDGLAKHLGMFTEQVNHKHTMIPMFGKANFGAEGGQRVALPGAGQ